MLNNAQNAQLLNAKAETEYKFRIESKIQLLQAEVQAMQKTLTDAVDSQVAHRVSCSDTQRVLKDGIQEAIENISRQLDEEKKRMQRHLIETNEQLAFFVSSYLPRADFDRITHVVQDKMEKVQIESEKFREELLAFVHTFSKDFEQKFQAFTQEIVNKKDPIPDLKKELEERMDLIRLDGTNSVLRTINCEKQLNLIEKKIEQLYLLIKKIDLQSQEK